MALGLLLKAAKLALKAKKAAKSTNVKKKIAKEKKLDKKFRDTGTTGKAGRKQSTTKVKVERQETIGKSPRNTNQSKKKESPLRSPKKQAFKTKETGGTTKRKGAAARKAVRNRK